MYSIVLMMAMSQGAAQPAVSPDAEFSRTARYGNHLREQVDKKGCKGCKGCNGCGGCYGCYGGYSCYGCYGYSCRGGCYGGYVSYGCGGCYGGHVSWGHGCYGGHVIIQGGAGGAITKPKTDDKGKKPPKPEEEAYDATRATLQVTLPADARLTIDDEPTVSTSATRTLVTPSLEANKDFRYTLKAQVVRAGKPLTVSREVTVRAGRTTNVNLDFSQASVAQK